MRFLRLVVLPVCLLLAVAVRNGSGQSSSFVRALLARFLRVRSLSDQSSTTRLPQLVVTPPLDPNLQLFAATLDGKAASTQSAGRGQAATTPPLAPTDHLAPLSARNLAAMRAEFSRLFNQSDEKITKYVQMGFHICVGGCDGCLNLKDASNKGLEPHYNELLRMHSRWENVTTLADYAVISAYEAVKAAVGKSSNRCDVVRRCQIELPFTAGRLTCANPSKPLATPHFPKGDDIASPHRDVRQAFKLSTSEMVALMGCHSLGGAHLTNSGFQGVWDLTPTVLDNGYFQALNRVTWEQKFMPEAGSHQWNGTTRNERNLMMLHADMILKHRFSVTGNDRIASCSPSDECSSARSTASIVDRFARSNRQFISTLGKAFEKMCNTAKFDLRLRRKFV